MKRLSWRDIQVMRRRQRRGARRGESSAAERRHWRKAARFYYGFKGATSPAPSRPSTRIYPNIKVKAVTGQGAQTMARIKAEKATIPGRRHLGINQRRSPAP